MFSYELYDSFVTYFCDVIRYIFLRMFFYYNFFFVSYVLFWLVINVHIVYMKILRVIANSTKVYGVNYELSKLVFPSKIAHVAILFCYPFFPFSF